MNWEPIDTAPKNELILTVWVGTDPSTGGIEGDYEIAILDPDNDEWFNKEGDFIEPPTHWMPLPDYPR